MPPMNKDTLKELLGQIPFTAELYWLMRQKDQPVKHRFSLFYLNRAMPKLLEETAKLRENARPGKNVLIFATLHYWIEHAALVGMALASQGHRVTLAYLPYGEWQTPINKFDLRRQNLYAKKVLGPTEPFINSISLLNVRPSLRPLSTELQAAVDQVTLYDTQYTLQVEDEDTDNNIYKLRHKRNEQAAKAALALLTSEKPEVVIVPNGTIQELGVVYRVAKSLKIPTVTYEFGDQRERIWLAQNREVMRQETGAMWEAWKDTPLTDDQFKQVSALFSSRRRADLWKNFSRLWQGVPAEGGEKVRAELGLDDRPVVLLPTNVLGDSLTLGRQVFSPSMANWIVRTVQYFVGRPDAQLVIRVHPGEVLMHGQSMAALVRDMLAELPEHIHLIGPEEKINTYDLIEIADVGLVYTTTVGLEMAMSGLPVIVNGQTHYRERGFTHDPDSWVRYFKTLGQILNNPKESRLTKEQVELAWRYAYRFFFDYPRPFPWHLVKVWDDYEERSLKKVFSPEGQALYGNTFRFLVGEPLDWNQLRDQGAV